MSQRQEKIAPKAYVRGAFLYSEDGFDYEERAPTRKEEEREEKIIDVKISQFNLKQEIDEKKSQLKKRPNKKEQKQPLIAIRDTPVDPVPQQLDENQKCERATQQQFEYFQSYISLKQKQAKFEVEEEEKINEFLKTQEKARQEEKEVINLVMEKKQDLPKANKKRIVKIKIKKNQDKVNEANKDEKVNNNDDEGQPPQYKVRVTEQ